MELESQVTLVRQRGGCWEANPGLLQEQQVFLTAEPLSCLVRYFIGRLSNNSLNAPFAHYSGTVGLRKNTTECSQITATGVTGHVICH